MQQLSVKIHFVAIKVRWTDIGTHFHPPRTTSCFWWQQS